jgi:hypothetical protein
MVYIINEKEKDVPKNNKKQKLKKKSFTEKTKYEKIVKEHKNIIRDFSKPYRSFIDKTIGCYYGLIHGLIVFLGGFTVVFSNNFLYLCIILFIVSLDAFAIVCLHDCPLTQLEEKYFGLSGKRNTKEFLHNIGIVHKCDHMYETQLEFVINMWMIVVMKILFLIIYQMGKKGIYNNI